MKNKNIISAKIVACIILGISFLFKIWLIIWQFSTNKFLVPPGGDPVQHLTKVQQILSGQLNDFGYPVFFHLVVASISKITHCDPTQVIIYFSIFLLIAAIPVFYLFVRDLFGFWAAFWATLIYMFASSYPLIAFIDGNYPEMLCYAIFTPLVFLCFIKAIKNHTVIFASVGSLFLILIATAHQLTLFVTIIVVVAFLVANIIVNAIGKNKKELKNSITASAVLALSGIIIFIIARMTFGSQITQLLTLVSQQNPGIIKYSTPINYENIYTLINPVGTVLGAAGLLYVLATLRKSEEKLLLIIWIITIWLLSRTSLSGVAPRYLRELAVPLSITGGLLIAYLISAAQHKSQKIAVGSFIGFLLVLNMTQINFGPALLPDGMKSMVWYRQIDKEKTYFLETLQPNSTILSNPSNPYINYYINLDKVNNIQMKEQQSLPPFVTLSAQMKIDTITNILKGVNYIFIGKTPEPNMDEQSFAEFTGYENTTKFLENYVKTLRCPLITSFQDGSKLYSATCAIKPIAQQPPI